MDWYACTIHEIKVAIFQAGNTSAGPDDILPLVIKKAWQVYKEEVNRLFQRCLEEGYHPSVFKNAILCALPKPGKQPRSLPRSYHLCVAIMPWQSLRTSNSQTASLYSFEILAF